MSLVCIAADSALLLLYIGLYQVAAASAADILGWFINLPFFVIGAFLIYRGRYSIGAVMPALTIFLIINAARLASGTDPVTFLLMTVLYAMALTIMGCFAAKLSHHLIFIGLQLIMLLIQYAYSSLYLGNFPFTENLKILFVSFIGLGTIGYFTGRLQIITNTLVSEVQAAAETSDQSLSRIRQLLEMSREQMEIGSIIVSSTDRTTVHSREIEGRLDSLESSLGALKTKIEGFRVMTEQLGAESATVKNQIDDQNSFIAQSSASIEEMTASLKNISQIAENKLSAFQNLVSRSIEGEEAMGRGAEAINQVAASSEKIIEISGIISSISSQTNLLAMNAAIEAAHAGDAGRGFAVVAEEIRKLAETTAENTKSINDTLNSNTKEIADARAINRDVEAVFAQIHLEINDLARTMEEFISGMTEVAEGSSQINDAVTNLQSISKTTRGAVRQIDEVISKNSEEVEEIARMTETDVENLVEINGSFQKITKEAENLDSLGKRNAEFSRQLKDALASDTKATQPT